ncbi:kxDL motif-containing protein 1-like [Asterias rubens]|uniref:kxDL motif-containing protein 1-like n=1 Tax=Asterias rubens TaxID=7604 RepID=UPI0014551463|nr:kxDL motif-containing protein 1-like [Asterias rubens]XP_033634900.1 kxDL motif-containing protein 1-like [Asterias rubens]
MATSATPGSDAFVSSLTSMVNREDTIAILRAQTHMLSRFEKTNETLSNFNKLSAVRYEKTIEQFKKHTQVLMDMKRDLDIVFRKIRVLKDKLSTEYPVAFEASFKEISRLDDEEEEEEFASKKETAQPASKETPPDTTEQD